jgi:hypothetical protein
MLDGLLTSAWSFENACSASHSSKNFLSRIREARIGGVDFPLPELQSICGLNGAIFHR